MPEGRDRVGGAILRLERLKGVLIGLAIVVAGVVIAIRGSGWGLLLIGAGLVFAAWAARWPTRP